MLALGRAVVEATRGGMMINVTEHRKRCGREAPLADNIRVHGWEVEADIVFTVGVAMSTLGAALPARPRSECFELVHLVGYGTSWRRGHLVLQPPKYAYCGLGM
jgi:hypothetical protein